MRTSSPSGTTSSVGPKRLPIAREAAGTHARRVDDGRGRPDEGHPASACLDSASTEDVRALPGNIPEDAEIIRQPRPGREPRPSRPWTLHGVGVDRTRHSTKIWLKFALPLFARCKAGPCRKKRPIPWRTSGARSSRASRRSARTPGATASMNTGRSPRSATCRSPRATSRGRPSASPGGSCCGGGKGRSISSRSATGPGTIQVFVGKNQVGEAGWGLAAELDLGDLIGVDGTTRAHQDGRDHRLRRGARPSSARACFRRPRSGTA